MAHNRMCNCEKGYCELAPWCKNIPERMREYLKKEGKFTKGLETIEIESDSMKIAKFETSQKCPY